MTCNHFLLDNNFTCKMQGPAELRTDIVLRILAYCRPRWRNTASAQHRLLSQEVRGILDAAVTELNLARPYEGAFWHPCMMAALLAKCPNVIAVRFGSGTLTRSATTLPILANIRELEIAGGPEHQDGSEEVLDLACLAGLRSLESLTMTECDADTGGTYHFKVTNLHALPTSLTKLTLDDLDIDNIAPISRLVSLRSLKVHGYFEKDDWGAILGGMTQLTRLKFKHCGHIGLEAALRSPALARLTNMGLVGSGDVFSSALDGLTALTKLRFTLVDEDIEPTFNSLVKLVHLNLSNQDNIGTISYDALSALTALTHLDLRGTGCDGVWRSSGQFAGMPMLKTLGFDDHDFEWQNEENERNELFRARGIRLYGGY